MKTYARWIDGAIAQIIPAVYDERNVEVPLESRFPPDVVAQLAEHPPRVEAPELTHPQLWERAIAEMRTLRQPILLVLDGLQSSALTVAMGSEDPDAVAAARERASAIELAKQGLRDITKINLSDCTTAEEMREKVGTAYAALVASLPTEIKVAFKESTK